MFPTIHTGSTERRTSSVRHGKTCGLSFQGWLLVALTAIVGVALGLTLWNVHHDHDDCPATIHPDQHVSNKVAARRALLQQAECGDIHTQICHEMADSFDDLYDTLHNHYSYESVEDRTDISDAKGTGEMKKAILGGKWTRPFTRHPYSIDSNANLTQITSFGQSTVLVVHAGSSGELHSANDDVVDPYFKLDNPEEPDFKTKDSTKRWDGTPISAETEYAITPRMVDTTHANIEWLPGNLGIGIHTYKFKGQTHFKIVYDFHRHMEAFTVRGNSRRLVFSCIAVLCGVAATEIAAGVTVGGAVTGTLAAGAAGTTIAVNVKHLAE